MSRIRPPVALALALSLAACGAAAPDPAAEPSPSTPDEPLPTPAGPAGGVTGMPDAPGPGETPIGGDPPPSPLPALYPGDGAFGLPPLEDNPETGLAESGDAAPGPGDSGLSQGAPTPHGPPAATDGAAAAIRAYYAALDAGDHSRAYALWSDGGRGSGQTLEQFAAAFASTAEVAVQVGDAGPVEGAAGSRYVEIPVSVTLRDSDGTEVRQVGSYTLRSAAVDGTGVDPRTWRIASARLRELRP